jgi:FixJ family two-component response regulator
LSDHALISIVDDDRAFRDSLQRLLKSFSYPVTTFPSAAAFLASACVDKTGCLIADINMPEMTGLELHRYFIGIGRTIPTILITAYPDEAIRLRALNDGVIGYLNKACVENDLIHGLRFALGADKIPP